MPPDFQGLLGEAPCFVEFTEFQQYGGTEVQQGRQIASAVGDGVTAAFAAMRYVQSRP